ncbi:thiamine pyrophosphate-requiring protein [Mesorhizobium sp. ZC-5]|uniref:thiamine pyrophosphate-requiring protein n=1 Tax=Mesorhizobium sp. ZC-5 TaxID=2986066 RepID=UPI0021E81587|nr:thiamine pyrophosphate-requiring protein [Mesorhizobium sp. ZC-5]MCV3240750.1 thiamine pyrophosphate-requiring protein [Mesorhizobium sp. ZC-5]
MTAVASTAERYLRQLGARGVDYLFGNAGTDAAPLIEAYAKCDAQGIAVPTPILATHENLALSMAHGYAMVSGKLPSAFVHVSVGTANAACAVMNAARENVPILFTAGRTPIYEDDTVGSRDSFIHWGQEMFDQASLVREFVKWDYELRGGAQVDTVVDRAVSIAMSEPRGPVYLSLPREVLAEPYNGKADAPPPLASALPPRPNAAGIAEAARILAAAERPLIVTGNCGRDTDAFERLAAFAEQFAIPVVQHRSRYLPLPSDHPMHLGFEPAGIIEEADAVLVLESDIPWVPKLSPLKAGCKAIHVGHDPLHGRIPIRGFQCDLALTCGTSAMLDELSPAMQEICSEDQIAARHQWVAAERQKLHEKRARFLKGVSKSHPIHPAWVSHCIDQVKGDDAIGINEYTLMTDYCEFRQAGTYFGSSSASGLGWGMGAALGAKLADPERLVFCVQGDGAYLFSNPVAGHYASSQHKLPVLFVVVNNGMWNAVRAATLKVYPDGVASSANQNALTMLDGLPAFEEVCRAAGGYGERVEDPDELPAALHRALKAVREEGRQALLNVICQPR